MREGENRLIKHNIARDIDSIGRNMQAFVTFMNGVVTKEYTLLRSELKFAIIVGAEMWPTSTPKNL